MTSFITMNRYKIKKYLGQLFDLNAKNQCLEMYDVLNLLRSEVYKYSMLMNHSPSLIEKAMRDVEYDLGHFTRSDWRAEAIRGHLKDLHDMLTEHEKDLSLYDRIKLISEDLDRNLSLLFTPEGTVKDDLLDSFDSLQSLAPEVKELGFEVFQLYRQTIRSANACKPFLPLEPADVDEKGRILVRPNEIKNLQSHTSPLLSSLGDLISVFHQPPAPPKEKKKGEKPKDKEEKKAPEGIMADVDELQRHQLLVQSTDLLIRQGWPWPEVCRHLNVTSEELQDIWELEEVPEKDEGETDTDENEAEKEEKPGQQEETKPGEKLRPEKKELEKFEEEEPADAEKKVKTNQTNGKNDA